MVIQDVPHFDCANIDDGDEQPDAAGKPHCVESGKVAREWVQAGGAKPVQLAHRGGSENLVDAFAVASADLLTPRALRLAVPVVSPFQCARRESDFHPRILAPLLPRRYLPTMSATDLIDSAREANAMARAALIEACDALTEGQRLERWYGDKAWSLHDIAAHIAVWQDAAARGLEQIARGEPPDIEGWDGDDDTYNAATLELFASAPWPEVMTALRHARERHETASQAMPSAAPGALKPGQPGHRLLFLPSTHDGEHVPSILEWRRARGY